VSENPINKGRKLGVQKVTGGGFITGQPDRGRDSHQDSTGQKKWRIRTRRIPGLPVGGNGAANGNKLNFHLGGGGDGK